MHADTLKALEFPGLLHVVQPYAASRLGQAFLAELRPLADLARIQEKFTEIRELQDLENREGDIPLVDFPDLAAWLAKAKVPGSLLTPPAFNDILQVLRLTRQVRLFLAQDRDRFAALSRLAGALRTSPSSRRSSPRVFPPTILSWMRPHRSWPGCAGSWGTPGGP